MCTFISRANCAPPDLACHVRKFNHMGDALIVNSYGNSAARSTGAVPVVSKTELEMFYREPAARLLSRRLHADCRLRRDAASTARGCLSAT